MVIVDYIGMRVRNAFMMMGMTMRFRSLVTPMLMLVMRTVCMQMTMIYRIVSMLQFLRTYARPDQRRQPRKQQYRRAEYQRG